MSATLPKRSDAIRKALDEISFDFVPPTQATQATQPSEAPAEPTLNPWSLTQVELTGKSDTWLPKLRKAATAEEAVRLAWTIGLRLSGRVPVEMALETLLEDLRAHRPEVLSEADLEAISASLSRLVDARQQRAVGFVTLPPAAKYRHDVEVLAQLPELSAEEYRGVILLAAYMGSGKTLKVGAPFSRWAQGREDGRFLATCHRQSLVAELARVLECSHYNSVERDLAWSVRALATCLPSIVKDAHGQVIDDARYVFVDEIAQVLRSIASEVKVADKRSAADVYQRLVEIVSSAHCVIGADAGMDARTLAFLEACRPGERFRIVQVPTPKKGLQVCMGFGEPALVTAYGEALARLSQGERLWIGCGEKSRAIEASRVLASTGKRVLVLHGDNRENSEQTAFWRDPEGVSRQYDAVIHTGVISSGMSITHKAAGPWFDHGMLLASGATITPADAVQMLRRVRYLSSWTVAVTRNNRHDIDNAEAILAGMQDAAHYEGLQAQCSDFDAFFAGVKADDARARADFAAGLWWVLQEQGFEVDRLTLIDDAEGEVLLKEIRTALREEARSAILNAFDLSVEEAKVLRDAPSRTEAQAAALLKHRIKTDLGLDVLDDAAIDAWDDGRGPRRMDRFSAAVHGLAEARDNGDTLALRRFSKARVLAYRTLFKSIKLEAGLRIDDDLAEELVRRVIENRYLFAFLGLVPAEWARYLGEGKEFPMPAYPQKKVGEILERMGLATKRREFRSAPRTPDISLKDKYPSGGSEARFRPYVVTSESWETMEEWAAKRNERRMLVEVGALAAALTDAAERRRVDRQPGAAPVLPPSSPEAAISVPSMTVLLSPATVQSGSRQHTGSQQVHPASEVSFPSPLTPLSRRPT